MKYLTYIFIGLLFFSCKEQTKPQNPTAVEASIEVENFEWMLGNWERVGEKEGQKTYEFWTKNNDKEYIGMGCTLKGLDTIWREDVLLADNGNGWNFEVVGLGDSIATVFKLTKINKAGFICENAQNEFPKKIEYAFDGKNINAVISGGGPTIPFNFVKMKQ